MNFMSYAEDIQCHTDPENPMVRAWKERVREEKAERAQLPEVKSVETKSRAYAQPETTEGTQTPQIQEKVLHHVIEALKQRIIASIPEVSFESHVFGNQNLQEYIREKLEKIDLPDIITTAKGHGANAIKKCKDEFMKRVMGFLKTVNVITGQDFSPNIKMLDVIPEPLPA